MAVRIVTDSTADLERDEARRLGIEVVPLNVHFGETTYRDGIDLSAAEFYARLPNAATPPRTSAPAPGTFLEAFERAATIGDSVLCITISGKLSGSFNAAQAAREHFRDPSRLVLLDSLAVTAAEANIVLAAATAANEGQNAEQVRAVAERARDTQELLVGLETLEYLQRGGRIGRARAVLGGLLNVKPLLTLREGEVAPAERVRSRARMLARLEEFALSRPPPELISICQAAAPEEAERLTEHIRAAFPDARIACRWIGPVVGLYTGPGAIGVAIVPREGR